MIINGIVNKGREYTFEEIKALPGIYTTKDEYSTIIVGGTNGENMPLVIWATRINIDDQYEVADNSWESKKFYRVIGEISLLFKSE